LRCPAGQWLKGPTSKILTSGGDSHGVMPAP
jgi:hypothetical protein